MILCRRNDFQFWNRITWYHFSIFQSMWYVRMNLSTPCWPITACVQLPPPWSLYCSTPPGDSKSTSTPTPTPPTNNTNPNKTKQNLIQDSNTIKWLYRNPKTMIQDYIFELQRQCIKKWREKSLLCETWKKSILVLLILIWVVVL